MKTGFGALTIANGAQVSDELSFQALRFAKAVTIYGPSALTGVVTVQVVKERTGGTFVDLQSGGSDITITAGNATVISPVPAGRLRLSSSLAEGAERSFPITIEEESL